MDTAGVRVGDELKSARISAEQAGERAGLRRVTEGPDLPSFTATLVGISTAAPAGAAGRVSRSAVFPLALLDEGPIGVSASRVIGTLVDGADVAELRDQLDRLPAAPVQPDPAEWVPVEVRDAAETQANGLAR